MADTLLIQDLNVMCRVGVFEWEQQAPQLIAIDVKLAIDVKAAAKRDSVKQTVDYGRLVTVIRQRVEHASYRLLETLAEEVATLTLKGFPTNAVCVRVRKQALPGIGYAQVEITRARRAK